jgi:branched-chain amino acid transport system permease protein
MTIFRDQKLASAIVIVALLFLGILPLISKSLFLLSVLISVLIFALFGAAWDLTYGVTGLANFGPGLAFGVGAFTLNFFARLHYFPLLAIFLAGIIAASTGVIMWIPSIRMSGAYLAIVTIAFLLIASEIALSLTGEEGFSNGISYFRGSIVESYYGALFLCIVGILVLMYVKHTRFGLRIRAIRDDEIAAKSVGIGTALHKLVVFLLSSFFLGLAGAYYTLYNTSVNYSIFSFTTNFVGIAIGVIGGPGSIAGSIIGSLLVELPSSYLVSYGSYAIIVYGLIMIVVMLFFRGGLIEAIRLSAKKLGVELS